MGGYERDTGPVAGGAAAGPGTGFSLGRPPWESDTEGEVASPYREQARARAELERRAQVSPGARRRLLGSDWDSEESSSSSSSSRGGSCGWQSAEGEWYQEAATWYKAQLQRSIAGRYVMRQPPPLKQHARWMWMQFRGTYQYDAVVFDRVWDSELQLPTGVYTWQDIGHPPPPL